MLRMKKVLSGISAIALGCTAIVAMPQIAHAETTPPPPSAYYDMSHSGTTLTDISGNGHNATLVNVPEDAFTTIDSGHAMRLSANGYAALPQGAITATDNDFTVEATVAKVAKANHFAWVIGDGVGNWNTTQLGNYVFVNPRDKNDKILSGIRVKKDASNGEDRLAPYGGAAVTPADGFSTLTMTSSGNTLRLYLNGEQVASVTHSKKLSEIIPSGNVLGYLGRSLYAEDSLFTGTYLSVKMWDQALSADEVRASMPSKEARDKAYYELYVPADFNDQILRALLASNSAADNITGPVAPPASVAGFPLTWASSDPKTIATDGTVVRPADADKVVTMTATDPAGKTHDFALTVRRAITGNQKLDEAYDALTIINDKDMRSNFSVPLVGKHDAAISWTVVDDGNGTIALEKGVRTDSQRVKVTRPATGANPVQVTLRATLTLDGKSIDKTFVVTVQPLPTPASEPQAYFWSYFTGEGMGAEKISFAASKGNDALDWNTLNNGQPYLESTLGTGGLRDPFIIRSADGDKFYLLATDLKIAGLAGGFDTAQKSGSLYLEIWESTDLIHWSAQRHVKVSSDYAGNTWAPEAFYLPDIDKYAVYWASNLYPTTNPADRKSVTYNRMIYVLTDDFVTFSEPQVWIDVNQGQGKGVIDVSAAKEDGMFYRVYKDESSMTLRLEKSTSFLATHNGELTLPTKDEGAGKWNLMIDQFAAGLPNGVGNNTFRQGEGPNFFPANPGDVNGYAWYVFIDQPNYHGGPNHYVPFATKNKLADAGERSAWVSAAEKLKNNLPQNADGGKPRHGTVLPITRAEYEKVLAAYQPNLAVTAVAPVEVTTEAGTAPAMPDQVQLTKADGSQETAKVAWETIAPEKYAKPGTFTVTGVAQDASRYPVTATVTVTGTLADWDGHNPKITTQNLLAEYLFTQKTGTSVRNIVPGGQPATVVNGTDSLWTGNSLRLTGGEKTSKGPWVQLPSNMLTKAQSATIQIETKIDPSVLDKNHFMWNIGSDSTEKYFFASTRQTSRTAITTGSWKNEYNAQAKKLDPNRWYSLTAVLDGDAGTLAWYIDGKEVAKVATDLRPSSITEQTMSAIARGPYPDPLFAGEVATFRVYDRALSAQEIDTINLEDAKLHATDLQATAEKMLAGVSALTFDDSTVALNDKGGDVVWSSQWDKVTVANNIAQVSQPATGEQPVTGEIQAAATVRGQTAQRNVPVTITAAPAANDPYGYLMVHFIEDSQGYAEKIYLDISRGNNPEQWDPLNDGKPILASQLGTTGVRDPYITYNPQTQTYYIIATDLRVFGGDNGSGDCTSWCQWSLHGSTKLNIWESKDLVHWSDLRQIEMNRTSDGKPAGQWGMAWAPEATWVPDYYGDGKGAFVVYWSTKTFADDDVNHTGKTYSRIMWGVTTDFTEATYSYGGVLFDTGGEAIDTTIIQHNGATYAVTKDNSFGRGLYLDKTTDKRWWEPTAKWTRIQDKIAANYSGGNPGGVEGPAMFKKHGEDTWYLYADVIPTVGYKPMVTHDLDAGFQYLNSPDFYMKESTKHGGIIGLTKARYDAIRNADGVRVVQPEISVDVPHNATDEQIVAALPQTVAVELAYGRGVTQRPVSWTLTTDEAGTRYAVGAVDEIGANLNSWTSPGVDPEKSWGGPTAERTPVSVTLLTVRADLVAGVPSPQPQPEPTPQPNPQPQPVPQPSQPAPVTPHPAPNASVPVPHGTILAWSGASVLWVMACAVIFLGAGAAMVRRREQS
ncbi:LamG-like jellyroll fold domain-containing protein [Trueperella sp. LYQ141]|uniref:LamG-like jellyroll fold domain-containing protein n=1 Tax=Trueperella sp. LYQ141 TaxID=3391058 RepID=UPI0039831526